MAWVAATNCQRDVVLFQLQQDTATYAFLPFEQDVEHPVDLTSVSMTIAVVCRPVAPTWEDLEVKLGKIHQLTAECRQLDAKQRTMLDHNAQTLANLQVSPKAVARKLVGGILLGHRMWS